MARRCRLLLPALLLLAAAAAVAADPELDAACEGVDRAQVAHPSQCHDYLVCCGGTAVFYECLKQRDGDTTPYPRYGTAQRTSYYNAFAGRCERFDETGLAPAAVCGNGNPNAGPVSSAWAVAVCTAKASYEATLAASGNSTLAEAAATTSVAAKALGREVKSEPGAPAASDEDAPAAQIVVLTEANATAEILEEAGIEVPEKGRERGRGRALLQAPGNTLGAFVPINNPDLGRPSTGTLAIHAIHIPTTNRVLLWGRQQPMYEPGMFTGGTPEVSSLFDFSTGTYIKTPMRVAPFCSGQSHLSDGTSVIGGGDWANGGFLTEGRYAIRTWDKDGTTWETRPEGMAYPHWYPTQLTLPDDRVLHVGGYASEADPPVPAIEIWDNRVKRVTTIHPEPFLEQLGGLNLYATTLMLPWTNAAGNVLFMIFSCNQGRVMQLDPSNNLRTLYTTPAWPTPFWCSAFSALGSAMILRLDPETGFAPELAMFGGSGGAAGACACDLPANDNAYRLNMAQAAVTGGSWAWAVEKMPGGRNMVDSVLLPNGHVLLVNGARFGNSNGGGVFGGSQARSPVYEAWLYNPYAPAGQRFTVMAASPLKRLYHSTAMLMPDGNVLIMGSEQDECVSTCFVASRNLHQYTPERFRMPYDFLPLSDQRPTINSLSAEAIAMGAPLTLTYTGAVTHAVIAAPAAVTHQTNMNQRVIKLANIANGGGSITVTMPPAGGLVAPPGWYMLFLMNGDIPCRMATWVRLTHAGAGAPAAAPARVAPGALVASTSTTFEPGASGAAFAGGAYLGAAAAFDFAAGGPAAYSGAAGASVTITTPGTATWHIQIFGPYIPLSAAKTYTAHLQIRASATARVTATWLRDGDFLPFGTTSFQVDSVFKDFRRALYNLAPPAAGNYHLQFEFGLAPAGTVFYIDDVQVFDTTLPPSPNPLPPVNGGGGGGGGGTLPPPPPPAEQPAGALMPAISEDFSGAAPYNYSLAQFAGAAATASFAGGAATVTVTTIGTASWNLQLTSAFVPFSAAASYSLRFRASAAAPGGGPVSINVLFLREGSFALLGLRTFVLSGTAAVIELSPPLPPPTDGNYHVQIEFGLAPVGTVLTFDDFAVYSGALPPLTTGGTGGTGGTTGGAGGTGGDTTGGTGGDTTGGTGSTTGETGGTTGGTGGTTGGTAATRLAATSTDFEGAGPFPASGSQFAGAAATFTFGAAAGASAAAGGAQGAAVAVATQGAAQWHLQVVGPWVTMTARRRYTVRVQARATAAAPVTLLLLRNRVFSPHAPSLAPVTVGPAAWTTLTATDVVLPATDEYHVQIEFGRAPAGTTLFFDNIEVFDTTDGPVPPPGATNPIGTGTTGGTGGTTGGTSGGTTGGTTGGTGGTTGGTGGTTGGTGGNTGGTGGAVTFAATSENFDGPAAPKFTLAEFRGADAALAAAGGAARATVALPGADWWNLQLVGPSVALDAATTYTITATVSATPATSIELLWLREAPTIAPIAPTSFAVGPTPRTITLAGIRPPTSAPHHVQFEFGRAAAGTVLTFDDIVVTSV
ncbi:MAG: hypothetical protein J3K34DRAFT_523112 [Monoraphidium minutum]|nr:MAG: hypothetical protein J3K34DRAFT_523112 [Monoraphidium minutum]